MTCYCVELKLDNQLYIDVMRKPKNKKYNIDFYYFRDLNEDFEKNSTMYNINTTDELVIENYIICKDTPSLSKKNDFNEYASNYINTHYNGHIHLKKNMLPFKTDKDKQIAENRRHIKYYLKDILPKDSDLLNDRIANCKYVFEEHASLQELHDKTISLYNSYITTALSYMNFKHLDKQLHEIFNELLKEEESKNGFIQFLNSDKYSYKIKDFISAIKYLNKLMIIENGVIDRTRNINFSSIQHYGVAVIGTRLRVVKSSTIQEEEKEVYTNDVNDNGKSQLSLLKELAEMKEEMLKMKKQMKKKDKIIKDQADIIEAMNAE